MRNSKQNSTICILEYGSGNTAAIKNMISYLGYEASLVSETKEISSFDIMIIPGVGAFDNCIDLIDGKGMRHEIENFASSGKKLLGICVGMQVLGHGSEEGIRSGLGLADFSSVKFSFRDGEKLPIPHVGWNEASSDNSKLEERYYFTHSYHAKLNDTDIAWKKTVYGYEFVSAVKKDNIFGVQFHPEKSHRFGLEFFKKFIDM